MLLRRSIPNPQTPESEAQFRQLLRDVRGGGGALGWRNLIS